ncbi:unnamed protein product [Rotaria sp. Silwood2]|nr:unnamed protein product [Rotaria sp. Silwood2]
MPLSSSDRFRIFKAKLNLDENKSLLQKFREKDAAKHRKSRQLIKQDPIKLEKIRAQNRARQAKRLLKLASEKLNSQLNNLTLLSKPQQPTSLYKCPQTLAKAVHRSERSLPASPTRKKEIIRHLAIKHGVLTTSPMPAKPTNNFSEATKNKAVQFYQIDEISSVATGKKDIVIVKLPDGSNIKVQKQYLVMTAVREVYEQFKLMYPNEKIGSTSFSLLRPKHVLPMSDIPQNVCLCKYHANIDLLLSSISSILNTPKTTALFREALVCDSNDKNCMSSNCTTCGDLKYFDKIFECNEELGGEDLCYSQWETINAKIVKTEKSGTIQDAISDLKIKANDFLMHSFITHVQYLYFEECKQNATPTSIVLQIDFSENYRTKYQDEVQNAFFNYKQVGLFNAVVWSGPNFDVINYSLISDDISHDKYSIHCCLTIIIIDLKKRFTSGRGRGAVDGVGGTVKRLVWKGVMAKQRTVRNAKNFAHYANAITKNINIILVNEQDIKSHSALLDQRWNNIKAIPNTLKIHSVKSLSLYNVEVKPFSKLTDRKTFCLKP